MTDIKKYLMKLGFTEEELILNDELMREVGLNMEAGDDPYPPLKGTTRDEDDWDEVWEELKDHFDTEEDDATEEDAKKWIKDNYHAPIKKVRQNKKVDPIDKSLDRY